MRRNLFILLVLFVSTNGFQDCSNSRFRSINETATETAYKEVESADKFAIKNITLIKYNFDKDNCDYLKEQAYVSDLSIVISWPLQWYHFSRPEGYRSTCISADAKYLGNNIWTIIPKKESKKLNLTEDITKLFKLVEQSYSIDRNSLDFLNVKTVNKEHINAVRSFFRTDNMHLEDINTFLFMLKCEEVNASEVIRSKQIGTRCYKDVPVIVGNITMFSQNGIDLQKESEVVPCHQSQVNKLNIFVISVCISIIIVLILVVIGLVCYTTNLMQSKSYVVKENGNSLRLRQNLLRNP